MAAVIPELSAEISASRSSSNVYTPAESTVEYITPELVDRAVATVLQPYSSEEQERYASAWGGDGTSEVAKLLQQAIAVRTNRLVMQASLSKVPVVIPYKLTDAQQTSLESRYPDMRLLFRPTLVHDHALAAADRKLTSSHLHAKIPGEMRYVDFGGSVLMHVEAGNRRVTVVGGLHDGKDAARETMVKMRLAALVNNPASSAVTKSMAASILANEGKYYQKGSLETFTGQYTAAVMSHVYDVPIGEIPKMMHRCGMALFEGALHYSTRFHLEDQGELPDIGARFKIERGRFHMGFTDSPSHWYSHDWKQFMYYGCDQVFVVDGQTYSYKVYERRGDTITFRVIRAGPCQPNYKQTLCLPPVRMTQVSTYKRSERGGSTTLVPVRRTYPTDVWERLVRAAMVDASRGALDFNEHVRTYNGITAGHKYNGVSTISQKVPNSDLAWIIVDSAIYALSQVLLLRKSVHAFVSDEKERRLVSSATTVKLGAKAFLQTLVGIVSLPALPFVWLSDRASTLTEDFVGHLISVAPVPRHIVVDGAVLAVTGASSQLQRSSFDQMAAYIRDDEDMRLFVKQAKRAEEEEKSMEPSMGAGEVSLDGEVVAGDGSVRGAPSVSAAEAATEKPDWVPLSTGGVIVERYEYNAAGHTPLQRKQAVQEGIAVCDAEAKSLEAWCAEQYHRFTQGGRPDAYALREHTDATRDVDLWRVSNGAIVDSVLGRSVDAFASAGVFCPAPTKVLMPGGSEVTSHLIPIEEAEYKNGDVYRVHKVISGSSYTGYVLTCRDLKVFNGPQIAAGLRKALQKDFRCEIAGMIGGPGCGKTTSIVAMFRRGDMVVTPLLKSAEDIRRSLVKAKKLTESAAMKVVKTLDSVLCREGSGRWHATLRAERVLIDESHNDIAAKYYAVLAHTSARTCMMFGDQRQIEPVVRADIPVVYTYVSYHHVVRRFTVFRGAAQIVACFNGHYNNTLRTANKNTGEVRAHHGLRVSVPESDDVLVLVMNQASKAPARKLYPGLRVATTHEAQGSEADTVILLNFELRKIGESNPTYLYNAAPYVNVALSRAKRVFIYAAASENDDEVKRWIKAGASPQKIAAVVDLSTAGQPYI